ncbi:MAG TPA: DUF167 domain-containing protein [Candidatus Gastranaerophilales bacterium]|nr:DUF167 domain-containing protein [Candidatus Gastranaerophilales bacterium]
MKKNPDKKPAVIKTDKGVKLNIRALPNASKCELAGFIENELKIKLDVPPIEGKANEKCVKFLSKILGVSKSSISIISGEKSRSKSLFITGDPDELEKSLLKAVYQ